MVKKQVGKLNSLWCRKSSNPFMLCQIIFAGRRFLDIRGKETVHSIIICDDTSLKRITQIEGMSSSNGDEVVSAILVLADSKNNTYWLEDAIAATTVIQLKAEDYGLEFDMFRVHKRKDSHGNEISKLLQNLFCFPLEIIPVSLIVFTEELDFSPALTVKINRIHQEKW